MFDSFLSELLILFLLFLSSARIFFYKTTKIDSLAIISPFALIISIMTMFIWNCNIQIFFTIILSLVVTLTNIRSIFRLSSSVFIDRYSIAFRITTLLELIIIFIAILFFSFFSPVKYSTEDFNISKSKYKITGTYLTDFKISDKYDFSKKTNGLVYIYESTSENQKDNSLPLLIFSGSHIGEVINYEPYFLLMAQKGYTIIASDFYAYNSKYDYKITNSKLFRRFFALRNYFKSKKENEALVSTTTIKNYKATAKIALELFGEERKLFFITDNISFDDIKSITEAWPVNTLNFFSLNKISEYKSSGFGFVEQTDVLVAKKLGLSKDSTFFIPRYVALKSDEEIKLLLENSFIKN
ncbi:MAG: hypothetical protein IJ312_00390 [Treponema sp.]|nr:hypothetical protein [Treponema sp.]